MTREGRGRRAEDGGRRAEVQKVNNQRQLLASGAEPTARSECGDASPLFNAQRSTLNAQHSTLLAIVLMLVIECSSTCH